MSFPDDYQRNQQAGGPSAQLADLLGLPRQILIDTTTWTVLLMDGVTEGGHKTVMLKDLAAYLQVSNYMPQGDSVLVSNDADEGLAGIQRVWSGMELRELFNLLATTGTPSTWRIRNTAMPDRVQESAPLITDLNVAVTSGWYRFNPASTLNMPGDIVATNSDRCGMLVIAKDSNNLTQVIFSMENDGKMWKRVFVAGAPLAWQGTAGVTQESVDAKVAKAGDTMTGRLNLFTSTAGSSSLRLGTGVAPTTPIDGDIWRRDADGGLRFRKGGATVSLLDSNTVFRSAVAHLVDQKSSGTGPDAFASGSWQVHTINTEYSDVDDIVTLSANQFTLDAGGLYKAQAFLQVSSINGSMAKARFYNVTDSVEVPSTMNGATTNYTGASDFGMIMAQGILVGGKTYQLERYRVGSVTGGSAANIPGLSEVYASIMIERLSHVI